MPVTEYWVAMYDKAYAHWADDQGDAKDTAAYVMSFDHIKRLQANHVEEHGARAILAAHKNKLEEMDKKPAPTGVPIPVGLI